MGYRVQYNLDIEGLDREDKNVIIAELRKDNKWAAFALDEDGNCDTETGEEIDVIVQEFSKNFPHLVFEINYVGDGDEDFGYIYLKNGKRQECPAIITFDDYDESKLK